MLDKTLKAAKGVAKEGIYGGVGFVGAGIVGSAVEDATASYIPTSIPYGSAIVNFLTKVLLYGVVDKKLGEDAAAGIATNAMLDVALRVQSGGAKPASPTLFGYNILTGLAEQNPDRAGYGSMPIADYAERQKRYGAMPVPPAVAERNRKYGAMPFEQHPAIVTRERRYGFSSPNEPTTVTAAMFGMQ